MPGNNLKQGSPVWTSQNFLTSSFTINRIIKLSNLCANDHVVEIGPGKGHITDKLISKCGKVSAVEIDRGLYDKLSVKYAGRTGLRLICGDFLGWKLPETPYKVFSNIPFNRTTDIIKKLTAGENPPDEAWLVMEKGAAKRFTGTPRETLSSLVLKPFFNCKIVYYFRREDFHPLPSVEVVLLHLKKKTKPDIPWKEQYSYKRFITGCLANPNGIRNFLTNRQISAALKKGNISNGQPSGDMLYVQWLCLFRTYLSMGKDSLTTKL